MSQLFREALAKEATEKCGDDLESGRTRLTLGFDIAFFWEFWLRSYVAQTFHTVSEYHAYLFEGS